MQRRNLLRIGWLIAALSAPGLLIFHFALLWRRLLDASITQPAVLARWIAAALLLAGLLSARRRGRDLLLVLLLLAALLHVGIPAGHARLGSSDELAKLLQIGLTAACGVFFSLAAAASFTPPPMPARLAVRRAFVAHRRAVATRRDRSPPTL